MYIEQFRLLWLHQACFLNLNRSALSTFSPLIFLQLGSKYKLEHGVAEGVEGGGIYRARVSWALQCGSRISGARQQTI